MARCADPRILPSPAHPGGEGSSRVGNGLAPSPPAWRGSGFDAVFSALAGGVIEGAQADCKFDVPDAPKDKFIDLESIVIN